LQRCIAAEFERRGARPGQVEVFPFGATTDFLRFLGRIDIALDPFPYGGGTTTFQCLWMGVPVVTLAGGTPMARNSVGPLVHAGLEDLVAASITAYRDAAVALARDPARLGELRQSLRPRLASSPPMDANAFARGVETAFSAMRDRTTHARVAN
jgi:predicted O-linked N-acetylglucosamine transferase (SPINDLY family)